MKGKHKIRLATPRETYDFTINRKVTIIRGDSGTGKSMLCKAVKMSGRTVFILDCDVECNSADDSRYWKEIIKNSSGTIWFIDEDFIYLETKEFARLVRDTDNYFVIISRKPLAYIPYSYIEIYNAPILPGSTPEEPKYDNGTMSDYSVVKIIVYKRGW